MYSFVGMYQGPKIDCSTNPFAWTMSIEFVGSFIVFAIVPLLRHFRFPVTTLAIAAALCLLAWYTRFISDFLLGVIFALLRKDGMFDELRTDRRMRVVAPAVAGLCLVAASYSLRHGAVWLDPIIAPVLVFAIYSSRDLVAFFGNAVSRFLGRISFSLYLVQWPVMISLTSWLIVRLGRDGLTPFHVIEIALGSTIVCIAAACLFEPVEQFTRFAGRRITRLAIRPQTAPEGQA